jgi:D-alanyl-D-alanine carboxypeptidase/D-alanyl-D-alanine-endopeptidase (penicillin-binding protein 4)
MSLSRSLLLLLVLALPAFAQEAPVSAPDTGAAGQAAPALPTADARPPATLASALATVEQDPIFTDATVSVQVVNVRTGEEVYHWGEDRALLPASVMKVLTTATALRELGPNYKFQTHLLIDGEIGSDGVLDGSVYLRGQGDPSMVVERLWRMALDLKMRGVREIRGDIVFDASYFADGALIPGWFKAEDVADPPTYFPSLGALSVNYNLHAFVVRPGAAQGAPAQVDIEFPSPQVVIVNKLVTGSAKSRAWTKVERELDEETKSIVTYTFTGNVPVGSDADTIYRPVHDPLANYMAVFESVVAQHGLKVGGRYRAGVTPAGAERLLRSDSEPLAEIVATTSKQSNNLFAEHVLRVLGAEKHGGPGTTEKGLRSVNAYLTRLGVAGDGVVLVNGSGLSRDIRLRPSVVDAVLMDMARDPAVSAEFMASLSVAGRDGTLWSRFREEGMDGRVRGKTGTLDGVHCLAGYVRAADDELYAFTFLVNDIPGVAARARKAHDRLVGTLAGVSGNVADGAEPEGAER